jgi:hypothetical protein
MVADQIIFGTKFLPMAKGMLFRRQDTRVELKTARDYAVGWVPEGKVSRDGPAE